MSTRKLTFVFLILSLAGLLVSTFFLKSYSCGYSIFCYNLITISKAFFYGMSALAIVFLILLFLPSSFSAWKKFAKWFVPLATLLFIFYPEPGSGDFFSPYPEQVFKWVSVIYVVASVLIIAIHFLKSRKLEA